MKLNEQLWGLKILSPRALPLPAHATLTVAARSLRPFPNNVNSPITFLVLVLVIHTWRIGHHFNTTIVILNV